MEARSGGGVMRLRADGCADMRGLVTTFFCLHRWPWTLSGIERRSLHGSDLLITSSSAGLAPVPFVPRLDSVVRDGLLVCS